MVISNAQWLQINEIVKGIYLSNVDQALEHVCTSLPYLMRFSHSMYHYYKRLGNKTIALDYRSVDLPESTLAAYSNDYENIDFIAWYSDIPLSRVYRDTDIIDNELRDNSELMKQWMLPNDMYYCINSTIAHNGIAFAGLSFFKAESEGDFTDLDKEMLNIINDHLSIKFYLDYVSSQDSPNTLHSFAVKYKLSNKEIEIIDSIKNGILRESLPDRLCISENTLKKHLNHIYSKLNINRYEQLLQLAGAIE